MTTANNCNNCGAGLVPDAKFCALCGSEVFVLNEKPCPSCGRSIDNYSKFCPQCGIRVNEKICPSCGHATENDSKFCPQCRTKIGNTKTEKSTANKTKAETHLERARTNIGKEADSAIIIKDLDEAIKLDPSNAEAYLARSAVHNGAGMYTSSVKDLDKANELTPDLYWPPIPRDFGITAADYPEILSYEETLVDKFKSYVKPWARPPYLANHNRYHDALKVYNHQLTQGLYADMVERGEGYWDIVNRGEKLGKDYLSGSWGILYARYVRRTGNHHDIPSDAELLSGHKNIVDLTDNFDRYYRLTFCQICFEIPTDNVRDRDDGSHIPPVKGIY